MSFEILGGSSVRKAAEFAAADQSTFSAQLSAQNSIQPAVSAFTRANIPTTTSTIQARHVNVKRLRNVPVVLYNSQIQHA
jgi:hypothetical protein